MDSDASWDDGLVACEAGPDMVGRGLCWMGWTFSAVEVEGWEDGLPFSWLVTGCGVSTTNAIG